MAGVSITPPCPHHPPTPPSPRAVAVYEDKRRTLPLHAQALSAAGRAAWLSSAAAVDLFGACAGVDPARAESEALCKALLTEVVTQHQAAIAAGGEVRRQRTYFPIPPP